MTLLDEMLDEANLFAAWERVRKNKGGPGVDGQTLAQFSVNVFSRLLTLKQQVERGEYQPKPLREVRIPKRSGRLRRLAVPAVRDRVLQSACTRVLAPVLEKAFEEPSFAYRVGRSVPLAVARVAWYRDRGYQWVVDADIHTFFDEVDHGLLLAKLRRTLDDHSLLPLIELWLAAVVQPEEEQPYLLTKGIPQGSPISPMLANLYLDDLDEALIGKDLRFVRFADDFLILCRDRDAAEQALEITGEVLDALKLRFQQDKTRVTHFDAGFRFLGVDFIRNLMLPAEKKAGPWVLPDAGDLAAAAEDGAGKEPEEQEPVLPELPPAVETEIYEALREPLESDAREDDEEAVHPEGEHIYVEENPALAPLLRSLFVTTPGLKLLKDGERLLVAWRREVLASIPLHKLDQIAVQGNQLVSSALLDFAGRNGIAVSFLDHAGRFQGHFAPARNRRLELDRMQYEREKDTAFKLMLARAFVGAKIHNARVVLRRFTRRRASKSIGRLEKAMAAVARGLTTADIDKTRGIEGAAARAYFRALAELLPDHWGFAGRRRRPPTDPFNVLLSYGYGVLFHTLYTLVQRRGLNAWLASLHASDGRHPALVSDLIEEFRPLIVDAVALTALLNNLEPGDFVRDEAGEFPCRLRDSARKRYLQWLQNKFRSRILHPGGGQRIDYHRLIQYQVWHYARVVLGEEAVYQPYRAR